MFLVVQRFDVVCECACCFIALTLLAVVEYQRFCHTVA